MKFGGLKILNPRGISEAESPDCRNDMIKNGRLKTRLGMAKVNTTALSSPINFLLNIKSGFCKENYKLAITRDGRIVEDPANFVDYTVLLLHFNGSDGAITTVDSSGSEHTVAIVNTLGVSALLLNGFSDYAVISDSSDWDFGTSGFEIETSVMFTDNTKDSVIVSHYKDNNNRWMFYFNGGNYLQWVYIEGGTNYGFNSSGWIPTNNIWYNIKLVRSGNTITFYIDGEEKGSGSFSRNITGFTGDLLVGARFYNSSYSLFHDGWIDEVIITKASTVVLLLHLEGVDGATTTTDSSDSGHFVTLAGIAQLDTDKAGVSELDTAKKKLGTASYLKSEYGTYVSIPNNATWAWGTEDWTIESFILFNTDTNATVYSSQTDENNRLIYYYDTDNNYWKFTFIESGVDYSVTGDSWSPVADTWYHVACVRSGNTITFYVDAVAKGSGSFSRNITSVSGAVTIGTRFFNGVYGLTLDGQMDELRVSKGIDRVISIPTEEYSKTG